jgi:hypothetical protein
LSWDIDYSDAYLAYLERRFGEAGVNAPEWDFVVPALGAWIIDFRANGIPPMSVSDPIHSDIYVAIVPNVGCTAVFLVDTQLERAIIREFA